MVGVSPEHGPDLLREAAVALGEGERRQEHLVHERERVVVQNALVRVHAHCASLLLGVLRTGKQRLC